MSVIDRFAHEYENNPLMRGLVTFILPPPLAGIDAAFVAKLKEIRVDRARTFFDELESGNAVLTPELLESEDFLHCAFITIKAALRTRRRAKIRFFARLLKSSVVEGSFTNTDEYEEYLEILDKLT